MMTAMDPSSAIMAKAINMQGTKECIGFGKYKCPAAGSLSQLRGGCAPGWISSTTKSSLSTTFCYNVLEDKMDNLKGKGSCQEKNSIMLEFDTRGEVRMFTKIILFLCFIKVDDFLRLVKDNHLKFKDKDSIWLGAKYSKDETFL
jgi:hypothetical protein